MNETSFRVCRIQELASTQPYDLLPVFEDQKYLCLLENPGEASELGRYSFLCTDPFLVFRSKRDQCFVGPPDRLEKVEGDPFSTLGALLQRYKTESSFWAPGLPPLLGGAVGYLGYEMLYLLEDIPDLGRDDLALPDCELIFCDVVVASDLLLKKTWLIANGFGSSQSDADKRADERLRRFEGLISRPRPQKALQREFEILNGRPRLDDAHLARLGIKPVLERQNYLEVVQKAKDLIFAGNVFEVCTTNRFDMEVPIASGPGIYEALRRINPNPFASYLRFPGFEVMSSSPERFMRLDRNRVAETRPIKGTRPRGRTWQEDQAYIQDLMTSEKDQAENIMIVDLARNDLGRVCEFGSVRVPGLRVVESYPFTHQLVSTVTGKLRQDRNAMDLIRAAFPGGSMTGAPKIEAMKIIDRLEPVKRGIYSGSIGYFDFDGSFDLNIVIRTLIKKDSFATFHVGGAVVADSVPEDEYQEILDKAHAMVCAYELGK